MISVVIADDQRLIRQAVVGILGLNEGIEVVGEAADGKEALRLVSQLNPDVVLMDIRMPRLDGIEATAQLRSLEEASKTKVLILTTFEDEEYVLAALRAGASGFIGKGAEPEEIVEAVLAIHRGDSLLSPQATRSLIEHYLQYGSAVRARSEFGELLQLLTEREQEILQAVGRGLSNNEIAEKYFISPHTAKTHVNRIMSKLNAHDRAQLVITAYESGLVTPGD